MRISATDPASSEMVKSEAKLVLSHRIDVEDTRGVVLTSVYFRDVVLIEA